MNRSSEYEGFFHFQGLNADEGGYGVLTVCYVQSRRLRLIVIYSFQSSPLALVSGVVCIISHGFIAISLRSVQATDIPSKTLLSISRFKRPWSPTHERSKPPRFIVCATGTRSVPNLWTTNGDLWASALTWFIPLFFSSVDGNLVTNYVWRDYVEIRCSRCLNRQQKFDWSEIRR